MNRKKGITSLGWAIKKRLTELEMDQKEFCRLYGIPEYRLSNLINGTRKAVKYRKAVVAILEIQDTEESANGAKGGSRE
ncbi:Rha family transcriptional regulator [Paenibacillus oryzae]|uniref:Rha family transcriptional regulator n=1 Tax=Paenibacillus oryzae TaxID=1844972 RepID=A0A1A5YJL0_9BACL|nr:Rha family transcriptional regulator [Paenibacillus oryzae]OBR65797.1 Rha family transcriptional regulator [Paenibacillus oryzae]